MAATEAAAEPEAEQSKAGQMRDTDEGSAAAARPSAVDAGLKPPPGWEHWNMNRRKIHKKHQRGKQEEGGGCQRPLE